MRSRCWTAGSWRRVSSLVPFRRQDTLLCEGSPSDFLVFGPSAGPGAPRGTCPASGCGGASAPRRAHRGSDPPRPHATPWSACQPPRLSQPSPSSPVRTTLQCLLRARRVPYRSRAVGLAPLPFDTLRPPQTTPPSASRWRVPRVGPAWTPPFYVEISQCSPRVEFVPTTWRRVHGGAAEGRWDQSNTYGGTASPRRREALVLIKCMGRGGAEGLVVSRTPRVHGEPSLPQLGHQRVVILQDVRDLVVETVTVAVPHH